MSDWDTAPASGWVDDSTAQATAGWHVSKHEDGVDGDTCHNCGQSGHFKSDCTEPARTLGSVSTARAFSGTCRGCGEEGHRSSACPQAVCKKCSATGHTATECSGKFNVYPEDLPEGVDADQAWDNLVDADATGDVDDFIQAFWAYCKLAPELTLVQLEECFRETDFKYYLIAKEQTVPSKVHTNKTPKPRRAILSEGWPKSPEENLERLQDAGFSMDNMKPYCRNCEEVGHSMKSCPQEPQMVEKPKVACSNCDQEGHYIRDCPNARAVRGGVECKHCGLSGHFVRDCPTKPAEVCRNCQREGHRSSDCVNERVIICRNCEKEGHTSRDCPEEVNMDNVLCRNCEMKGHYAKDCSEPKDWGKVKCRNCEEFGHGAGRCPNPPVGQDDAPADQNYTAEAAPSTAPEGDWMSAGAGAADAGGAGDWNAAPAAVSAW
ncbi:unnamed protein product [Aureobasidium pullulans]|nr:unnamed protein product [Aureobasidium pullulans]